MNRPLRFAVVGCGMLARSQHIPNIVRSPNMSLAVCCDLSDDNLRICREAHGVTRVTHDFRQAVDDPDVDVICLATTEKLRLPVIEAAARAGKPIYVEKPLATSLQEMLQIQEVVHASGIAFCIGHNRRSAPAALEAHRIFRQHMEHPRPCPWRFEREPEQRPALAADGAPGMAVRVNDDWHSWKSWVFDKTQAPHGPMLFEMTHFTDLCNWFLQDEPIEVMAMSQSLLNHGVVIRYRGGAMASIFMNSSGTFGYPKELYEMMGAGGMVAVDHLVEVRTAGIADAPARTTFPMLGDRHPTVGVEGGICGWLAKKRAACEEAAQRGDPMLQFTAEPDKGHARHMERFVEQICGGGAEVCGVDDAIDASRVAFAAIESAQTGVAVKLARGPA